MRAAFLLARLDVLYEADSGAAHRFLRVQLALFCRRRGGGCAGIFGHIRKVVPVKTSTPLRLACTTSKHPAAGLGAILSVAWPILILAHGVAIQCVETPGVIIGIDDQYQLYVAFGVVLGRCL